MLTVHWVVFVRGHSSDVSIGGVADNVGLERGGAEDPRGVCTVWGGVDVCDEWGSGEGEDEERE